MTNVTQEDFWSANPCGSDGNFKLKAKQRNSMENWWHNILKEIANSHENILEVGCGQGIEAYHLCSYLRPDAQYTGIDYSERSVEIAEATREEAAQELSLNLFPNFSRADALNLPFRDGSFDCVYSFGVVHHTLAPERAIEEIHRVLLDGGIAYVMVYRKFSPKVSIAKLLRALQSALDKVIGTDRVFYKLIHGRHFPEMLGTMLLECFGVPHLFWYSKNEVISLFKKFELIEVFPCGYNLPHINPKGSGKTVLGYFWLIKARKMIAKSSGSPIFDQGK